MASKNKNKMEDVTSQFIPGFKIKDIKFTERQRTLISILRDQNTKVVFVKGPAGTSKTFVTIFGGLMAIRTNEKEKLKYVRAAVESSEARLGYLPGSSEDKINVFCTALYDKLEELLSPVDTNKLMDDNKIQILSPNFLRGVTFSNSFVVIDEAQELSFKNLVTTISRIGENTTMVFCYDEKQSDIRNSGIGQMAQLFDDEESRERGIFTFEFTSDEVMRSEILKFIVKKLEKAN